ncbi:hypothetical protein SAMN06297422_11934 [Lachnospiraceae bacterium]|nr:hypothetical protein SAMN06297422_11934 [Lachnospiraceae bacterium]
MEKNGVTKAKSAVSITKKELKKAAKKAKKAAKKAEKRERKDIKAAYTKALRKQSPDKMIAILAIILASAPVVLQLIVDKKDAK